MYFAIAPETAWGFNVPGIQTQFMATMTNLKRNPFETAVGEERKAAFGYAGALAGDSNTTTCTEVCATHFSQFCSATSPLISNSSPSPRVVVNPGWVKTDMDGPNATLTAQESATAIRRLIEKLGSSHTGMFFHYDGIEYPW